MGGRKKGKKKGTGKGQLSVAVEATSATPAAAAAATTSSAAVEGCYVGKKKKNAGGAAILAKLQQTGCPLLSRAYLLVKASFSAQRQAKERWTHRPCRFLFFGAKDPPLPD